MLHRAFSKHLLPSHSLIGLLFIELVLLLLLVLFSPRLAWILHYTPFDPVFILVYLNRTTPRVLFESKRSKQERARRHRSSEDDRNKKYDTRRKEASREITRRRYVRFFIRWNFTCVLFVCVCVSGATLWVRQDWLWWCPTESHSISTCAQSMKRKLKSPVAEETQ